MSTRPRTHSELEPSVRGRSLKRSYVSLTSHAATSGVLPIPLNWGATTAEERGPVVSSVQDAGRRNSIGVNGGAYGVYRALSIAAGALNPSSKPDFTNTQPAFSIGPFPAWGDKVKICTLDPFGAIAPQIFAKLGRELGVDILPTIAITKAHIDVPEIQDAIRKGRLVPDGKILLENGSVNVTKAAIEPCWYLPTVAERFGVSEAELRELLFTETNGSYPELITRTDLKVPLTCRVHDECNGSDVFGSDICTCRPYLMHAIEESIVQAQTVVLDSSLYFRKEGRALGEVTKYLVYNARKRTGDKASEYFNCTAQVAGVEDSRFQALMPDVLHWLGITQIDRFVSMSNMKYDAIVNSGIKIVERVPLPKELVPADAQVEMDAKVAAGYEGGKVYDKVDLEKTHGRAGKEFGIDSVVE
ncbi:hypothetical protein BASA81_012624 [Batrachochytrium salamandrivorans]|nr:hypothetical protein BASA81_012624 [Batrachochytrium salamandrivorans]